MVVGRGRAGRVEPTAVGRGRMPGWVGPRVWARPDAWDCLEAPGPADGALLLQDGDVQRHLYLQDVLMQVADAPEKPR